MSKVKFNLKNVHYALITEQDGTVTFGTPVKIPGAVALSLEPSGEVTAFHADGILYYNATANNGYTGDLEMAMFPDKFLMDVFQYTQGAASKVLTENASKEPKPFALLFEEDGDAGGTKFVLYNVTATRPTRSLATTTTTKEPKTQKISITAAPMADGRVMAMTGDEATGDIAAKWYTKVFEEAV